MLLSSPQGQAPPAEQSGCCVQEALWLESQPHCWITPVTPQSVGCLSGHPLKMPAAHTLSSLLRVNQARNLLLTAGARARQEPQCSLACSLSWMEDCERAQRGDLSEGPHSKVGQSQKATVPSSGRCPGRWARVWEWGLENRLLHVIQMAGLPPWPCLHLSWIMRIGRGAAPVALLTAEVCPSFGGPPIKLATLPQDSHGTGLGPGAGEGADLA